MERDPRAEHTNLYKPGILADWQIAELCQGDHPMIDPFEPEPMREVKIEGYLGTLSGEVVPTHRRVVSYGLGHYGYDMRVADQFKVFTSVNCTVVDPKKMDKRSFVEMVSDKPIFIPPNSFVLARSVEHFNIPRRVMAVIIGKSTYARCGLVVNCTPIEPEWRGYLTIEISNTTPLPAVVYPNEGIAQVMFFWASAECKTSYADKGPGGGKYQNQGAEITLPRM